MPERSRSAGVPSTGDLQDHSETQPDSARRDEKIKSSATKAKLKSPPPANYTYTYPLRRVLTAGLKRSGSVVHPVKDVGVLQGFCEEFPKEKTEVSSLNKTEFKEVKVEEITEVRETAVITVPSTLTDNAQNTTDPLSTEQNLSSASGLLSSSSSSNSGTEIAAAHPNPSSLVPVTQDQTTAQKEPSSSSNEPTPSTTTIAKLSKEISTANYFCNRRTWITTERMNELRRKAQDAVKQNKTFTIRGCFHSVRNALMARGWVEKLDAHRKHVPNGICQVTYDDLAQGLPKRKPGETRRAYLMKCERNIMSRFLEHMPIDFLWTNRKEKCDYIDQAKNPGMTINKFHRAPFTTKEGLCNQLKEFHWFYEEGTAEMYFPRCFNVWSPEELGDFIENYKLTACIGFIRYLVDGYRAGGFDAVFSPVGKIPFSAIDFAFKRCAEYIDSCHHNDIDVEDPPKVWEHDWDAFLYQQYLMANEEAKITADTHRIVEHIIRNGMQVLQQMQDYWPQYSLDGYRNLWIVKPANKCRGRGIQLMDNLKKILSVVNPAITSKSRYVVQKYIERPLIIHQTKFDIRQWFLITNVQPLVVWMYKESYLRFSSQEYSLTNHHESVHLTNHAIQKKYTNGKRDRRLPNENMWDCYSFQAYLRQIGKQDLWHERIYPGMRKAIIGTMLASQENMDRRPNTFELFGADFMICEDFYPWLIEINSSPDLGATTSVTARMCPQCLEDVVKVVIDRRTDPKTDIGNFDLIYRQMVPPTPAYMGLNLFVKGKQIVTKANHHHNGYFSHHRRERSLHTSQFFRQRTALVPSIANVHKTIMPTFNATELLEKSMADALNSSRSSVSGSGSTGVMQQVCSSLNSARQKIAAQPIMVAPCPNLLRTPHPQVGVRRRSFTNLTLRRRSPTAAKPEEELRETSSVATKRHRSCGPCISAAETGEKKFKFIIRKCTMQKQNALESSSINRNEDSKASTVAQLPVNYGRSQSCVVDRKFCRRAAKAEQNWSNVLESTQKGHTAKAPEPSGGQEATTRPTTSLHAIGRGLTTWKFNRKRNTAKAPMAMTSSKSTGNLNTRESGSRKTTVAEEETAKRKSSSRNTKC